MKSLKKSSIVKRKGPVVFIIMDGIGIGKDYEGNAFINARTPVLDDLIKQCLYTELKAHGTAVGLPSDGDMGNSEVGHNALGAGRIFSQGAKLVSASFEDKSIFKSDTWKELIKKPVSEKRTLHLIGLLSDGNVHSHIKHLFQLISQASAENIGKLRIHILLDGRDVPETSAHIYIKELEQHLLSFNNAGRDYRIASGGGRMVTTMDRYEADWDIVKRGWDAHVLGIARPFTSAMEAVETFRKEDPKITDQYLPAFTITDNGTPVGKIEDGDSVILFNFRGDRAIEISRAFEEKTLKTFDRVQMPDVCYAGIMQYDGDLNIPSKYLVQPPRIDNTISEYLAASGVTQYAISETQKFGHVTYFWNGNRTEKFDPNTETYMEIPSDRVEFNERPWMKAAEITDSVIDAVKNGKYDFIRLNYANGDMVGHTGHLHSAIIAAETVDLCLSRLLPEITKAGGIALITADHGNLDEMYETDKKGEISYDKNTGEPKKKTSHTLNPVPFIIFDPEYSGEYTLSGIDSPGLANVASTILDFLNFEPPADYLPSLIIPVEK